jgi:hypothetical protein
MPDAAYYRQEAKRHRELAAEESDPALAKQLLGFARDYDVLAAILEAGGEIDAPPPTGPVQHQPTQQQQKKAEDDK